MSGRLVRWVSEQWLAVAGAIDYAARRAILAIGYVTYPVLHLGGAVVAVAAAGWYLYSEGRSGANLHTTHGTPTPKERAHQNGGS